MSYSVRQQFQNYRSPSLSLCIFYVYMCISEDQRQLSSIKTTDAVHLSSPYINRNRNTTIHPQSKHPFHNKSPPVHCRGMKSRHRYRQREWKTIVLEVSLVCVVFCQISQKNENTRCGIERHNTSFKLSELNNHSVY